MSDTETPAVQAEHEHSFPVQPPEGHMWAPGPCRCGKTWELAQAEKAMAGALAAMEMAGAPPRPPVVCLCGSTRFGAAFREADLRRTLAGEIVLSTGCDTKTDGDLAAAGEFGGDPEALKQMLHKRKIDLADYVLVVSDESGYFGDSTASGIRYAAGRGKPVQFAVPAAARRAEEMDLFL